MPLLLSLTYNEYVFRKEAMESDAVHQKKFKEIVPKQNRFASKFQGFHVFTIL